MRTIVVGNTANESAFTCCGGGLLSHYPGIIAGIMMAYERRRNLARYRWLSWGGNDAY